MQKPHGPVAVNVSADTSAHKMADAARFVQGEADCEFLADISCIFAFAEEII